MVFRPARYQSFIDRRRARQGGSAAKRAYTFELAALHLELLVAMAAVDEQVHSIEVEEVLDFLDRARLGEEDEARLEQLARAAIAAPPHLDKLIARIGAFVAKPGLATLLVADLARVAAADARADPREVALMEQVCAALNVDAVAIRVPDPDSEPDAGRDRVIGERRAPVQGAIAQHRVRTQVRRALEQTYAERDATTGDAAPSSAATSDDD
ncbi:MAG: Tellurite resistance protein TerB [Thermoleophilia bacterium]|nr:Tellurite resistance protein TerB [Thermoleophilia bacterium]